MLTIQEEKSFRKDLKKMVKRRKNINKLKDVVKNLAEGVVLHERFRDHELKGNYVGMRECHIEPDWLLIYCKNTVNLILSRTGSHSDLF